jgi:PmbA protein
MLSPENALDRLDHALTQAKRLGATAADAIYVGEASTGIQVRLGQLEDIGRSEGAEAGIRVFVGDRAASVSTSDLSPAAIETAVERALAMAREATPDPFAGLAPSDLLATGPHPDLDLADATELSADVLKARALEAEDVARAFPGVTNSEGASASSGGAVIALATSHGFRGGYRSTSHGLSASVIAGTGADMQRDYAHHGAHHLGDLDGPEAIGRRAAERAVARLNPVKLATGTMPVLFDPRVSSGLIGHLLGAISGSAIARRTSFLLDTLGTQIFASGIRIVDAPRRPRGSRSKPFDGEGLPTAERALIDDGVLTGWLLDSASARQLGLTPTGHASRGVGGPPGAGATNVHLEPGTTSRAAMIADVKRGFLVTELIGMGVNGLTGDYSRGAAGFLIENGEIAGPVAEVTIAGNLKDMFRALVPADDLEFRHAVNAPTCRIDGMTVAGA